MNELKIQEIIFKIKKRLKEKDFTYKDLSEITKVSLATINDIMRGQRKNPRMETLLSLTNALDINLNNFNPDEYKYIPSFELTEKQQLLLKTFNELKDYEQAQVIGYAQALAENNQNLKNLK